MYFTCLSIFILLAAHCFGDYVFQNDYVARNKYNNFMILLAHCLIYSATCLIGVALIDILFGFKIEELQYCLIMFMLVTSHCCIDIFKIHKENRIKDINEEENLRYLYIDQAAHVLVLILIYAMLVVKIS